MAILSKFFFLFLALALLTTAAVNFYLIYLLGQVPLDLGRIRRTSILTATGILVLILLLIVFFVFAGAAAGRLFAGSKGLLSILILLLLAVVMGLDFAIPPVLKGETPNVGRARLFAIIASIFGTLLFLIVLFRLIFRATRAKKQSKKVTPVIAEVPESSTEEK